MGYLDLLLCSSSLEGIKLENDERRYFALHPKTGKAIIPKGGDGFKDFISYKTVEIQDDRR